MKQGLTALLKGFSSKKDFEENFAVKSNRGKALGKKELLALIPNVLQSSDLQTLGIVLDADASAQSTWQSVRAILEKSGFSSLPSAPNPDGTIIEQPNLPKVGIWIMPDNQSPGEIEDFFLQMIPAENALLHRAEGTVKDLIAQEQNLFPASDRSKAQTHTWLAWQPEPGRSMGVALKSNWAEGQHPLAERLAAWFTQLFDSEAS